MRKYELLTGKHTRYEDGKRVRYVPGDEIELSEHDAEWLSHRIRPLATEQEPDPSVSDMDWRKLVAAVEDSEDLDYVQSVLEQERQDRERPSVIKAAETRIEELSE